MNTLREALDAYHADPVNADDRPQSWQALDALLDACEATLAVNPKRATLSNVEKEIAHLMQVAEANVARGAWVATELPVVVGAEFLAAAEQGFDAGYMAACRRVLATILRMKEGAR